ncbi:coproporphyrinogen III oxidase [candidate division KSB3 bacterium]|uniref:Heme chaperone HemW n=1 Tax=candidate division KSB3 bacterium TaxID=2044937 RepID=A0A2G6E341_9BACT|nr:MAG: coproporphyrinogen III oxidase [candidate division KSB3 bacterium]PIE28948.1 MAG: coproporphyrinogen III oxidase [candidate division KSB3 bacterium]
MPHAVIESPDSLKTFFASCEAVSIRQDQDISGPQSRLPLGVYLHIPFCLSKCAYCDAVSYAGRMQLVPEYVRALHQEWLWYAESGIWRAFRPSTFYIGGGTPSSILDALLALLERLSRLLPLASFFERTIEINPGTVRLPQLQQLRTAGINRLSIGIQSFHDDELRLTGRMHSADDAQRCVREARQAGFDNISLDLISALPGSTFERWAENLRQAIALGPEHLSIYTLSLEEGTPFWRQYQDGMLLLPEEELQIRMYCHTIEQLTAAGYEQYEISNFARPGRRSQHNQIYWRNEDYLGIGAGAWSSLHGVRSGNYTDLDRYMAGASRLESEQTSGVAAPLPPTVEQYECLDHSRQIGESIMMNLRLIEGIDLQRFRQRFGVALEKRYARELEKLAPLGLLDMQDGFLRLSPRGLLLADEVCREFI